ncbi:hypothetical protein MIMGU_mgv1a025149mg [Erythranthe guttata]|uniref:AAA+ ATPase domain-containing protein n=1 Tax=Erythranthe guttata TaxID=4155 RepID=A0A022QTD6_ERYGU|nr:hypothetical protein MIMGU_mgv1a025149mg [Erythranthe guttata]
MPSSSESNLATAKAILSAVGSIAATAMVVRSVASDILPRELHNHIFSFIQNFFSRFSNQLTLVIDEFDGIVKNEIYESAEIYLGPKTGPKSRRLKISKPEKEKHYKITTERDQEIVDTFSNEKFKWISSSSVNEARNFHEVGNPIFRYENKSFELTFHKRNKDLVLNSSDGSWTPATLDHPSTFETLAMDSDKKEMILEDLERFVRRKDYYRKVGKAWKRGYLLYGPPGTGKSSLIAAMANYLNFDIYDLELSDLRSNNELKKVLLSTANNSILVVEDIDRTIDFQSRQPNASDENQVTLSGLLNFIDGLWSSCGDERIIIFTTNHVEKLDPALLRPGRMDVHINMSYCTFCGFKLLASNYLGINNHILFEKIEGSVGIAKVTPAEVAEQLLKNDDPNVSLRGLINFIHNKIKENEEAEAEAVKAKAESDEKLKVESEVV